MSLHRSPGNTRRCILTLGACLGSFIGTQQPLRTAMFQMKEKDTRVKPAIWVFRELGREKLRQGHFQGGKPMRRRHSESVEVTDSALSPSRHKLKTGGLSGVQLLGRLGESIPRGTVRGGTGTHCVDQTSLEPTEIHLPPSPPLLSPPLLPRA